MMKQLIIFTIILVLIPTYCSAGYPDQLYKIVGLLNEQDLSFLVTKPGVFSFGTFWQSEYKVALELHSILLSMRSNGLITGDIVINTDSVGRTDVIAPGARKLISQIYVKTKKSSPTIRDDFFLKATDEQRLVYLQSAYKRWGVHGHTIFINPGCRLIDILLQYCADVKTIQGHANEPGIYVVIFEPKDTLKSRLQIKQQTHLSIIPQARAGSQLLHWSFPYDTYDERYSITLHLSKLSSLNNSALQERLRYFEWTKRELAGTLSFYEKNSPEKWNREIVEIRSLIKKLDHAIMTHEKQ